VTVDVEQVRALFGEDRLHRVTDQRLLAGVADAPSRALLADVGLPDEAMKIFTLAPDFTEGPRTWAEREAAEPGRIVAERTVANGDWLLLGMLLYSNAALDPETGQVWQLPEVGGPPHLINRSLDAFIGFLCAFEDATRASEREKNKETRTPGIDYTEFCEALGETLEARLREVDAEAVDDEERVWSNTLFEISEAMW
jgi:hypothetical protein